MARPIPCCMHHVTRTRRAHEVTAACLYILQQKAYRQYFDAQNCNGLDFNTWCSNQSKLHPQFHYWSLTLHLELTVLLFVRSIRESDFDCYVDALSQVIPWFFALDHHHYVRWATVHLRDMMAPFFAPTGDCRVQDREIYCQRNNTTILCYGSRSCP